MPPSKHILHFGEQDVYMAQDFNEAGKRYDRQHDRYAVTSAEGISPQNYKKTMYKLFDAMMEQASDMYKELETPGWYAQDKARRTLNELGFMRENHTVHPDAPEELKRAYETPLSRIHTIKRGGATCTMLLYDPESFSIELGTIGDSPAYLVLSDGVKRPEAIRINAAGQSRDADGKVTGVHSYTQINHPSRIAYTVDNSVPAYRLQSNTNSDVCFQLQPAIDGMAEYYHMDKGRLTVSLVLASDGIEGLRTYGIANHLQAALQHQQMGVHPAQALMDAAMLCSQDNQSIIVIPDIRKGKGKPIAACVSDGIGRGLSYAAAQCAAHTFATVMEHMRGREQGKTRA